MFLQISVNAAICALNPPEPQILNPKPQTPNPPKPQTLNPKPQTLNPPKPQTPDMRQRCHLRRSLWRVSLYVSLYVLICVLICSYRYASTLPSAPKSVTCTGRTPQAQYSQKLFLDFFFWIFESVCDMHWADPTGTIFSKTLFWIFFDLFFYFFVLSFWECLRLFELFLRERECYPCTGRTPPAHCSIWSLGVGLVALEGLLGV